MKIDGYSVFMGMEHFNYRSAVVESSNTTTTGESFKSDESLKSYALQTSGDTRVKEENGVIKSISASLLKSISDKTRTTDSVKLSSTYIEAEALNFQTKAYIKAGDKEMEINLDVSLSRSFVQQMSIESVKALQDPLILNLDGSAPSLSTKTFAFDIDSDGEKDQISMLGNGSAFLALDKNDNKKIDNGSELFGAASGNGFEELRAYDDDNNGWIDENDKIFDKLRVWKKSEGKDELIALGEVGIGAIFLGDIATPFELKSSSNEQLGVMRKSGFFLFENGNAGMISQVDLAVSKKSEQESLLLLNAREGLKKLKALTSYKNDTKENEDSMEKRMEQLQKRLRILEAKLARAEDAQRPSLQAQIGLIFSQMLALISKEMQ